MDPALPAGLRYVPDFVDAHEETGLRYSITLRTLRTRGTLA